jgi:hypothetical protein
MILEKREKLISNMKLSGVDRDLPVLVEVLKNGGGGGSGNRDSHDIEVDF